MLGSATNDCSEAGHVLRHAELISTHLEDCLEEGQLPGAVLDDAGTAENLFQLHLHIC